MSNPPDFVQSILSSIKQQSSTNTASSVDRYIAQTIQFFKAVKLTVPQHWVLSWCEMWMAPRLTGVSLGWWPLLASTPYVLSPRSPYATIIMRYHSISSYYASITTTIVPCLMPACINAIVYPLVGLAAMTQTLNHLGQAYWDRFSTVNYFDENGMFIVSVYAFPLIFNGFFTLVSIGWCLLSLPCCFCFWFIFFHLRSLFWKLQPTSWSRSNEHNYGARHRLKTKRRIRRVVACATMNKHMYVLALLIHE